MEGGKEGIGKQVNVKKNQEKVKGYNWMCELPRLTLNNVLKKSYIIDYRPASFINMCKKIDLFL